MAVAAAGGDVTVRGLLWVGPATVAASVLAVWIVQRILLAILPPLPRFSGPLLDSSKPAFLTAVLVTIAVVVFPLIVVVADDYSWNPLRTFRRIALGVLLVSCIPNLLPLRAGIVDLGLLALMVLHVVAWAVTVTMLTRLAVTTIERPPDQPAGV
jgi:hypothetical protein